MEKILNYLSSYENILWDWNGTLLNDVYVSFDIVQKQMSAYDLNPIKQEELKNYFCFPIYKYYQDIGFPACQKTFLELTQSYMSEYTKRVSQEAALFSGTHDLLSKLNKKKQFVLSAAEEKHLRNIVSSYDLSSFFTAIYGLSDTYGVSKVERCKELIKEKKLDPAVTIMVGDTSHDAEVAEASGIDVLLVADGFQSYKKLSALGVNVLQTRYLT